MTKHMVQFREKITINTDPQRRCYNGCHFSSEEVWTDWKDVCAYSDIETARDSAATFKRINPKREYRIKPERSLK
jgi:hypothetical protein